MSSSMSNAREDIEFDRFGREIVHLDLETWVHPTCSRTLVFPKDEVPLYCRYCNTDVEPMYLVELNENFYRLKEIEKSLHEKNCCRCYQDGWLALFLWIVGWFLLMFLGGHLFNQLEEAHYMEQKRHYEAHVAKVNATISPEHFPLVMELCELYHKLPRTNIWHFEGATFFAVTVATTVGYGAHAPQTDEGKIAFIFFSIFAILSTALTVRQLLAVLGRCFRRTERYFYRKNSMSVHQVHAFWVVFTTILLFSLFWWQGSVYAENNNWGALESTYFLWTTFTTVGLGDVIPREFLSDEGVIEHALPLLIAIAFLPIWMWSLLNWMYLLFVKCTFKNKKPLPDILEDVGLRLLHSNGRLSLQKRDRSDLGNSKRYFKDTEAEYTKSARSVMNKRKYRSDPTQDWKKPRVKPENKRSSRRRERTKMKLQGYTEHLLRQQDGADDDEDAGL